MICVLQDNFDYSVGLYKDFIVQSRPTNDNDQFKVLGFEGGGRRGYSGGQGKSGGRYGGEVAEKDKAKAVVETGIVNVSKVATLKIDTAPPQNMETWTLKRRQSSDHFALLETHQWTRSPQ